MIHILPPHIASQIAAGEVVQRPASVVKELLENAVDSGALHINLILSDAGSTLMQVTDDGCGMSAEDAYLAFERHATSKISSIEDLQDLHTFGFRGEALASIASVAHVRLRTKRAQDPTGTELEIAGSAVTAQQETVCADGTDICVRNLFFNVPARRRFLKSQAVEYKHIVEEFKRVALCHPECAFSLTQDGRALYHLNVAENLKQRIIQIMGKDFNAKLLEVCVETHLVSIHGYISRPEDARKAGAERYFFVNQRFFRSPYLQKAVTNAYNKLITEDRTPSFFLYFSADPSTLDVNVHPAKTEVKFEDESVLFTVLQTSIKETLGKFSLALSIEFDDGFANHSIPVHLRSGQYVSAPKPDYDPLFNPFEQTSSKEYSYATHTAGNEDTSGSWVTQAPSLGEEPTLNTIPASSAGSAIIRVGGKYLLTPVKSGVMVVHIQRSWERIYFDEFSLLLQDAVLTPQKLLFAVALNLQPHQTVLVNQYRDAFLSLGFAFDTEGTAVTGAPASHPTDEDSLTQSVLELLESFETPQGTATAQDTLALALARRKAATSHSEAFAAPQLLIDRLFACKEPSVCPSGNTCFVIVPTAQIDKLF